MSKYGALTRYLNSVPDGEVRLNFADIERVVSTSLPDSARKYRAWWSNNPNNSVMTKAWLDAGFRSEKVDMENESLVFRRLNEAPDRHGRHANAAHALNSAPKRKPLLGGLKGTVRIHVDVTLPLDEIWSANEGRL